MDRLTAKNWSQAKTHFKDGARRVECTKVRQTAPHCPDRVMQKTCHTQEEAYNFYYGRQMVKQVRKPLVGECTAQGLKA